MTIQPPEMAKMEKVDNATFQQECEITGSLSQISNLYNQTENQFAIVKVKDTHTQKCLYAFRHHSTCTEMSAAELFVKAQNWK